MFKREKRKRREHGTHEKDRAHTGAGEGAGLTPLDPAYRVPYGTPISGAWGTGASAGARSGLIVDNTGRIRDVSLPDVERVEQDEPIRAWKTANLIIGGLDGRFVFAGVGMSGMYGVDERAVCLHRRVFVEMDARGLPVIERMEGGSSHRPPVESCSCGFYAHVDKNHDDLVSSMSSHQVLLEVELYGDIIEGTKAYRAEHQRVLSAEIGSVYPFSERPTVLGAYMPQCLCCTEIIEHGHTSSYDRLCGQPAVGWFEMVGMRAGTRCVQHAPGRRPDLEQLYSIDQLLDESHPVVPVRWIEPTVTSLRDKLTKDLPTDWKILVPLP